MPALREWSERALLRCSGLAVLLVLWELLPRTGAVDAIYLPPFSQVIAEMGSLISHADLIANAMVSLWRVSAGITAAFVLAAPLGIAAGYWLPVTASVLYPLFRILSQINPFSLAPVFLLFFGIGEEAKLAAAIWVAFWPILFHTLSGTRSVNPLLLQAARSMTITRPGLFRKVLLPEIAPYLFQGVRSSVQISFFILISGEMLGGSSGLGWMLHVYGNYFEALKIYAVGMAIAAVSLLLSITVKHLEKGLFFWKETAPLWNSASDRGQSGRHLKQRAVWAGSLLLILMLTGAWTTSVLNEQQRNPLEKSTEGNGGGTHEHHHGEDKP